MTPLATASSPSQTIGLNEVHGGHILLLINDVIMPEMSGRELAEKMLSLFPGLRVLFMSG